jgi:uncharacterized protein (DUF1499 family)
MLKRILIAVCGIFVMSCAGVPPTNLGVKNNTLRPCPGRPICVISQGGDENHYIEPLHYTEKKEAAFKRLKDVILSMEGTRFIEETDEYMRFEFKTPVMGFVDDVEFYLQNATQIHVRSSSRHGFYDFGTNRRRVERIRELFEKASN